MSRRRLASTYAAPVPIRCVTAAVWWSRAWSRSRRSAGSLNDVLAEEFRIVLLELEGQAAKALGGGWHPRASLQVSLRGQHPVVTVYGPAPAPTPVTVSIGEKSVRVKIFSR